jgi:hypothetical protein
LGDFFQTAEVRGQKIKNNGVFFFDNLVYTWTFHNLKEKVKKACSSALKYEKKITALMPLRALIPLRRLYV